MTSRIRNWSSTAASNNSTPPNGAPEGATLVNQLTDILRQVMAEVRAWWEVPGWIDFGHTPTYSSATAFTVTGNQTAIYEVGRRVRAINAALTTIHGTISASVYSTTTLVTVVWDSGSLDNTVAEVAVGAATIANKWIPVAAIANFGEFADNVFRIVGSSDPTKKLAFEVDGNTTGTTRTATFPDENITVVGAATAQTLSNKTFTQTIAIAGTASGPATITMGEDTDNGTNKSTVTAPAALSSDVTSTLPSTTGTLANRSKFAYLSYEVAAGSGGGTATADAWTTRPINTETDPDGIVALSSNTFMVTDTGTYKLGAVMMFFSDTNRVGICKARIQNTTDAVTVLKSLTGGLGFPSGSSGNVPCEIPSEVVTLTAGKTYALQYYCDYTGSAGDLGYAYGNAGSAVAEVYAKISIEMLS